MVHPRSLTGIGQKAAGKDKEKGDPQISAADGLWKHVEQGDADDCQGPKTIEASDVPACGRFHGSGKFPGAGNAAGTVGAEIIGVR